MTQTAMDNGIVRNGEKSMDGISISGAWIKAGGVIVALFVALSSFAFFVASRPDRKEIKVDAQAMYKELATRIHEVRAERERAVSDVKRELSVYIASVEGRVTAHIDQLRKDTKEVRDLLIRVLQNVQQQTQHPPQVRPQSSP